MIKDIAPEGHEYAQPRYDTTVRALLAAVHAAGGGLDTRLTIEAAYGEPVYIEAWIDPKKEIQP